jgi:hypothetical protein
MRRFLAHAAMLSLLLASIGMARAANVTLTPIVPPTETGENSLQAQQVVDMARLKVGTCSATTAGAEPTFTATCNGASGIITLNANMTKVSGALDNVTVTNSKVQAGDMVQCTLDSTGAAAAAAPVCSAVQVAAGSIVFQLTNVSATSPAANIKFYFLINTQGNPN